MALNEVIKKARLKRNLKQEDAAKLVGVTVQTYSKWENGKTEPKASQIAKMSKILAISTNEICNGQESKKLELIDFMKIISEISKGVSDFELKMAIWESIDNDTVFIENLRNYNKTPEVYLNSKENYSEINYEIQKENDPTYYDPQIEFLKDLDEQEKEISFLKNLSQEEIDTYTKVIKEQKEK